MGPAWITIDTSRVALALARTRLMAARYPWYLLADSREGRAKEGELTKRATRRHAGPQRHPPGLRLRARAAHHPQVDRQQPADRRHLGEVAGGTGAAARRAQCRARQTWEEWQIPRELPPGAPASAKEPHAKWWEARIARQKEIDASIAARAEVEYLYDKPYVDNARVRVAGPFTVESLSPHRVRRRARRN